MIPLLRGRAGRTLHDGFEPSTKEWVGGNTRGAPVGAVSARNSLLHEPRSNTPRHAGSWSLPCVLLAPTGLSPLVATVRFGEPSRPLQNNLRTAWKCRLPHLLCCARADVRRQRLGNGNVHV